MNKEELLHEVRANAGLVTEQELLTAYHGSEHVGIEKKKIGLSDVLYYIGGGIIALGIGILVAQNWDRLATPAQILVTLGVGIAAFITGVLLNRYEDFGGASMAFFLVSAVVLPIGLGVVFDKAGLDTGSASVQALISFVMLAAFVGSFFLFKRTLFTLFSIIYGTWLFFALVQMLIGSSPLGQDYKLSEYRFLVVGLVYMLLGYYFRGSNQSSLTGALYGFGSLSFLGATLALGGFSPNQNMFWELVYPLLVFGIIFLSIRVKSKAFLVFGSLFLMSYIFKLTGEYFSNSLGWPLALVLAGLLIIAIAYYAVRISRKYLSPGSMI
jgi:hypothetical protein